MAEYLKDRKKQTILSLQNAKKLGRKLSMVTCYDATFADLVNQTPVDVVLVGDSLAGVVLGHDSTVKVTLDAMVHHGAAVSRRIQHAHICVDMPFMSYRISREQTLQNAMRLMQSAGAESVKVEGPVFETIQALTEADVPVVAHLGLTPQSVHSLGGYRVQGRGDEQRAKLILDALEVEKAGAVALVLEMVPEDLAQEVTEKLSIPTIGIGAGRHCDGQVLVLYDLLGLNPQFNPKFLKKYANLGERVIEALNGFDMDVKNGSFPEDKHSFSGVKAKDSLGASVC